MRTLVIITLRIFLFIFDFISTVLAIPAIIVGLLFTTRIQFLIRWLIVSKRKRLGLLNNVRKWRALDRLKKIKKKKSEFMFDLVTTFTSGIVHELKSKN